MGCELDSYYREDGQQAGNCELCNEFPVCMKGRGLLISWPSIGFSVRILLLGTDLNCTR